MSPVLLLTCEHAGNRVPEEYAEAFRGEGELLSSHRGWDPGALPVARIMAQELHELLLAPLQLHEWSRLVADVNRSEGHPRVIGEPLLRDGLTPQRRAEILARFHRPYREGIRKRIADAVSLGAPLLHVGVHTFTPILNGVSRTTDLGLLYDPARPVERRVAEVWAQALRHARPDLTIHRNRPYKGVSDGLTTWIRRGLPDPTYGGIELEVNSRLVTGEIPDGTRTVLAGLLARSLSASLDQVGPTVLDGRVGRSLRP